MAKKSIHPEPLPPLSFHPATAERWGDLERLFGARGACGGCWCMVWRLARKEWLAGKGESNRQALRDLVLTGVQPGVLAYPSPGHPGDEAIGWCAVAPREDYPALARSRVLKPVDARPVWSVSCLFVHKDYRRRGLSVHLLRAAVALATSAGATLVEGYPIEPTLERTPDPFVWTGTPAAYRQAGFQEIARRSPTRPVMRWEAG